MKVVKLVLLGSLLILGGCGESSDNNNDSTDTIQPETIKIMNPIRSDAFLSNPGIGIQHAPQFDYNDIDPYKTDTKAIASTYYERWNWSVLEPEKGVYDFSLIDKAVKKAKSEGKTLSFRVMAMEFEWDKTSKLPEWLLDEINVSKPDNARYAIPDFSDPNFIAAAEKLIHALSLKYNNHNIISSVDVGFVGSWGEWNLSGSLNSNVDIHQNKNLFSNYNNLIQFNQLWHKYFTNVPIISLLGTGYEPFTADATSNGSGWRADCLGDWASWGGSDWNHMINGYPDALERINKQNHEFLNTWKKAPVEYEICYTVREWVTKGFTKEQIQKTFDFALNTHASRINFKTMLIPVEYKKEFDAFFKQLGYRLNLNEIEHKSNYSASNKTLEIQSKWLNTGSAPTYYDYHVAYKFFNNGKEVLSYVGKNGTNQILPSDNIKDAYLNSPTVFIDSIPLNGKLKAGEDYDIYVALVNNDNIASVNLPIKYVDDNHLPDGYHSEDPIINIDKNNVINKWYEVSEIDIVK